MSINFIVYVAFDDNTPSEELPFQNDPCLWCLREDYALNGCGERRLFAALGFDPENKYPKASIPLRGLPDFIAKSSDFYQWAFDDDYIGWLDADELFDTLINASITEKSLSKPVKIWIDMVRYLASIFGDKRVRVIFKFVD